MRSRRTVAAIAVAVVAAASVGGYLVGSRIQSPAEVAARTAPPEASPILVPAELRLLQTDIVTRGTARFILPQTVSVASSNLKVDPGIVTQLPAAQTQLAEGGLVAAASGRPLFLLQGAEPMYRDLGPGSRGTDVQQLEEALVRLGYRPGAVDGLFDRETATAIAAWYRDSGWQPFEATPEQIAAIRALKSDALSAQKDRLSADDAVAGASADLASARASATGAGAAVATAQLSVQAAEADAAAANEAAALDVAAKRAARDALLSGPASDADRLAADQAVRAAEADLAAAEAAAQDAADALEAANQAVDVARAEADAANVAADAEVSTQTVARNAVYADPASTPVQRAAADTAVQVAESAATATRLAGQASIDAATDAAAAASRARDLADQAVVTATADLADTVAFRAALDDPDRHAEVLAAAEAELASTESAAEATRIAGELAMQSARDGLSGAEAGAAASKSSVGAAGRVLRNAKTQKTLLSATLAELNDELATVEFAADIQVPADEVLFLPSVPVRIEQVDVVPGDQLAGPILTATQLQLAIDTSLPLDEASLIKEGMTVQLDEPSLGLTGSGTVGRVADSPGTDGVDGFHIYAEILVDEAPSSIVGTSVRLTIPIESTGGEVLAVPVNALFLAADGSSRVQIQRPEGLAFVTVEPGLSAAGFAAVTPIDGTLEPGDLVVIGFDTAAAPGA